MRFDAVLFIQYLESMQILFYDNTYLHFLVKGKAMNLPKGMIDAVVVICPDVKNAFL